MTGLVIEGGGMRGIFAAGVLEYLLDNDIKVDYVIGVSAGACHGCSYVSGQKGRAFAVCTDYMDDPRYGSVQSLLKTGDYFGRKFMYHTIPEELNPVDNESFKKSGIRFEVGVFNCITGESEYPEIKDMFEDVDWIAASASLPLFAKMVDIGGYQYMDGGLSDSIPVKHAQEIGCDKVIVILTRERGYRKAASKSIPLIKAKYKDYPKLIEALKRRHTVYNETLEYIDEEEKKGNVFVIAPVKDLGVGRLEKDRNKLKNAYLEGYYVTESYGDKLKEFLEK
ncbi:MAG TPA: patatin family protein [Candidatus Avanaerovorax faecigallinarum]|nr:patatin family protein [Candidatus Avanaerovorax faecigallinarum]